jgi:alpha/beta superfamily hydrolase
MKPMLFGMLLCIAASGANADQPRSGKPDLEREQRMAQQILDAILDGDPVELQTIDGLPFLGIQTRSVNTPARGTVIVLHGRGYHPDWDDVVQPLRVGLTESGWDTLSIQLPVLGRAAKYHDYFEIFDAANLRIEAAIAHVHQNADALVVLLAHSCGAHMAQHWVHTRDRTRPEPLDAFVGIGMGATDLGQPMREAFALDQMKIPLLDVYASNDFPAVLRMAPERLRAMERGGNEKNAQLMIADSEHYFAGRGDELLQAIAAWLNTL